MVKSRKIKLGIAIVTILIIVLVSVAVCELRIKKARRLYYGQGEYFQAYQLVENIPTLGREELIRMKIGWLAGDGYESYMITKRIRLSDASPDDYSDQEAYQEAFWELMFGLYVDLREVNNRPEQFNAIELDEYNRFIDLMYSELLLSFHMTREEANALVEKMQQSDDLDAMEKATDQWLDDNFFE